MMSRIFAVMHTVYDAAINERRLEYVLFAMARQWSPATAHFHVIRFVYERGTSAQWM